MRILVTGGAGFIGSHITDALLGRGDQVMVVDDLSNGRPGRLDPGVTLHTASVTDAIAFRMVVDDFKPDLIFHLAAQIDVRRSVANPIGDAAVNVSGTINVLQAAQAARARVLFAGTGGALYGRNAQIPSPEDVPPEPEAPYGTAKYCAEQYIGLYNRLYGARHTVLRLANVYGPRQSPAGEAGVISIFCDQVHRGEQLLVYGDGMQTRDYVNVSDVVSAFLAAADVDDAGTWNIGTGIETSVLDLVNLVGDVAGRHLRPQFVPARPGELPRSALDVSSAAKDLGWKAETALSCGIRAVYAWAQAGQPDRVGR